METTHSTTLANLPDAVDLIESTDSMQVAFDRVVQTLATRRFERLEPINVDVPALVTKVLGAVPKIMRHRALLAQLVTFDLTQVDELKEYALALAYAHALRRASDLSPVDVRELVGSLRATRRQLLIDARALASRGLIDGKRLAGLKGGSGYLAVAFDVVGVVGLMLESWPAIAEKTGATAEELRQARADANRLVVAVGRKRQSDRKDDPDELRYRQIYSLLARAYSEVRGALRFVRREAGDADWIAPSPYPGRAKRSKKQRDDGVNSAAPKKDRTAALSGATRSGRGRHRGMRRMVRLSFKGKLNKMTTDKLNNTVGELSPVSPTSAAQAPDPDNPATQNPAQFHLGFERVKALLSTVSMDDLEPINLEVPSTCATVIGAYPEVLALRSQLEGLSTFDISHVDNLRDYALALGHTHAEYRAAGGTSDNVGALAAVCLDYRDRFHADGTALGKRDLLDASRVAKLRGGNSYRMVAFDVIGLSGLFTASWDTIKDKTALTLAEIDDARANSNELVAALGLREQSEPAVNEIGLQRQQSYTLLVRAYNETRDAIAFIRRAEGDVDDITPSLYAGRARRAGTTEVVEAASPTTSPTGTLTAGPAQAAKAPANDVPVGFPGGSPFAAD